MQLKPLELHPLAEEEYLSALDWYRSKSFQAAQDFEDVFWRAIYTVEDTPERWPVYFSFFRKYTIQKFPFSIVYQIEESQTFVIAVAHGHRKPGYWMDRV